MADEESKLEVRDLREQDQGPYLTVPNATLDLEARIDQEPTPVGPVQVNPNPVGSKDDKGTYVGTDPIYQNASTDANRPFDAEEGVEKDVHEVLVKSYDTDGVEGKVADDYGLGGKAEVAGQGTAARTYRTVLPGQEGYDLKKAEEQNGPPLRVYADESNEDGDDDEVVADQTGTNFGSTVEAPPAPGAPEDSSEGAGDKPADKAKAKAGRAGN